MANQRNQVTVTDTGIVKIVSVGTQGPAGSSAFLGKPIDQTSTATGNELSISTNDVTVAANADVTPSGNALTSSLGDAEQASIYAFTGNNVQSSTGVPNIRTDVSFTITGVSVTSATGTLQGTFWSQVDDSNSGITWTEVHKAA